MTKQINEIGKIMYKALKHKYEGDILCSKASLMVYYTNAVGIGEHPQHIEEMNGLIEKISAAKDNLEALEEHTPNSLKGPILIDK